MIQAQGSCEVTSIQAVHVRVSAILGTDEMNARNPCRNLVESSGTPLWRRSLTLAIFLLAGHVAVGADYLPTKMGDLDGDRRATVLDLQRLVNHLNGTAPLPTNLLLFADVNLDGHVDKADVFPLVTPIL